MPRGPTAKRYAQAAFDIAWEAGQTEGWLEDIRLSWEALQDEALRVYLEAPQAPLDQKVEVLRKAMSSLHPMVVNLIALLTSRNALRLLPGIVAEYQQLVDAHLSRQRADVITAVPMEDQQQERLGRQLTLLLGKEVILTTSVDPEVLGGLVARIGDRIIDGSTRGKLVELRKSLAEVPG